MKHVITSYMDVKSLIGDIGRMRMSGWKFLFRGHASNHFKLLSMVGRKQPISGDRLTSEYLCFQDYLKLVKNETWLDFKLKRDNEDLFFLSIGRHLGLDCRLLDWTTALDTALYFATSDVNYLNEDAHLWIMAYNGSINSLNALINPFDVKELTLIKEDYYIPVDKLIEDQPLGIFRRFRQNGFFIIIPSDLLTTPLDRLALDNIRFTPLKIKSSAKSEIVEEIIKNDEWLCLSKHIKIEDDIKAINSKYFLQT